MDLVNDNPSLKMASMYLKEVLKTLEVEKDFAAMITGGYFYPTESGHITVRHCIIPEESAQAGEFIGTIYYLLKKRLDSSEVSNVKALLPKDITKKMDYVPLQTQELSYITANVNISNIKDATSFGEAIKNIDQLLLD